MAQDGEGALEWMGIIAERKIQEAIDDGLFDNLPGAGRPIDLSRNPYETPGMGAYNDLLRRNGVLPAWAQLERAIDIAIADADSVLARWKSRSEIVAAGEYHRQWARARADYERHLRRANDLILQHSVTSGFVHRLRTTLPIEELLETFDRDFPPAGKRETPP